MKGKKHNLSERRFFIMKRNLKVQVTKGGITSGDVVIKTIDAALAEEDLANYSTNIKWTIQDKFKNGENIMGYIIYGYNVLNNKELTIN